MENNIYVVKNGKNWAVKRGRAKRATKIFDTQKEAYELGRKLAIKTGSELKTQGKDGRFKYSESYGNESKTKDFEN